MTQAELAKLQEQAAALSLDVHIRLMERLARQSALKSRKEEARHDRSSLYGPVRDSGTERMLGLM